MDHVFVAPMENPSGRERRWRWIPFRVRRSPPSDHGMSVRTVPGDPTRPNRTPRATISSSWAHPRRGPLALWRRLPRLSSATAPTKHRSPTGGGPEDLRLRGGPILRVHPDREGPESNRVHRRPPALSGDDPGPRRRYHERSLGTAEGTRRGRVVVPSLSEDRTLRSTVHRPSIIAYVFHGQGPRPK